MANQYLRELAELYPVYIPLKTAAPLLGVSPRQLSRLIADGREPFCQFGVDIGLRQHYVKVLTGRLLRYLTGGDLDAGNQEE